MGRLTMRIACDRLICRSALMRGHNAIKTRRRAD